jgi:hypothetical protein
MRYILMACALVLSACAAEEQVWTPPAQTWNDIVIRIETRPTVLRSGMNEFLVITQRQQRGFSADMMVDVRTESSNWKQAMPDGALGIFRRALPVKDVRRDHLYVRLVRKGEQHEMVFALAPEAEAKP